MEIIIASHDHIEIFQNDGKSIKAWEGDSHLLEFQVMDQLNSFFLLKYDKNNSFLHIYIRHQWSYFYIIRFCNLNTLHLELSFDEIQDGWHLKLFSQNYVAKNLRVFLAHLIHGHISSIIIMNTDQSFQNVYIIKSYILLLIV